MGGRLTRVAVSCLFLLLPISLAGPASAEWFADLYVGSAFTQSHDVTAKSTIFGVPFQATAQDIGFDTSVSFGGRGGYWFDTVPWLGLGLDVFHFAPDISSQTVNTTLTIGGVSVTGPTPFASTDLSVTAISFDLMLRWPLMTSPQFPKGRLQPYFSAGPTLFIAKADDTTNFGPPNNQSNTDTSLGVKVGAGITWLITKNIGVFGEYRFTHFSPEFTFSPAAPFSKTTVDTDINTHHLLVGATYRF